MHVISRFFSKFSFIFSQPSCPATNMPDSTLSLDQLIAIYSF